ncbi:MAG: acyl transferase, partial [Bacteroidetes bacterium]|nr:acyl transferase [Bacteroidota bacterium]
MNQKSIHKFTKRLQDTQIQLLQHDRIFNINSESEFTEIALEIFRHQYQTNTVYREWTKLLNINAEDVKILQQIPYLPIHLFKEKKVVSGPSPEEIIFTSSATTSQTPAKHYVTDLSLYEKSFAKGFERFYGDPKEFCILALLPNYLQRGGSSLVYMCDALIKRSGHPLGGFFLDNLNELIARIERLKAEKQKT